MFYLSFAAMASMCGFPPQFLLYNNSQIRRRNIIAFDKQLYLPQATSMHVATNGSIVRRSANYQPSLWSYDYVQSLTSKHTGKFYAARLNALKEAVKKMICKESGKVENPLDALNLVDDLQRLGISYHFASEISDFLEMIYSSYYKSHDKWTKMDLRLKALGFRLLRQHGYHIPQEIFLDRKDESGNFKPHVCEDMVGILNLYEASYLSVEDESILDEARDFAAKHLKENLVNIVDENTLSLVTHALALPLHWRVPRVEAKWFIDVYERRSDMNPTLIELAKLDFNMVQAIHQEDLKHSSRWWRSTCWEKLSFARDRLVENFFWTVGVNSIPHFGGRETMTKINALITTIDDVYDVYGTLDELEQFTDAVSRWDANAIEALPDYMKICFLGFYNSINDMAYNVLTNKGFFSLPYLRKAWEDLCKAYLVEAKWYSSAYTPTFKEYMNNACISISAPVILMHCYFLSSSSITGESLQCMGRSENIVSYVSLILRLANDLSTSSDEQKRGDVPKSIQCYMNETGAPEDEAQSYMKHLIMETWKKLNKESKLDDSPFTQAFIESATNLARMSQFMYGNGDGHGCPEIIKSHILSLLVNPIQGIP